MATIHNIEPNTVQDRKRRRELLAASEAYHNAFAREIALSAMEMIKEDLQGAVEAIADKLALESATPFQPGKAWFSTNELTKRWGCSQDFIFSIPDTQLKPHYFGNSKRMKRFLAIDVYRHEGLLTKAEHKLALKFHKDTDHQDDAP